MVQEIKNDKELLKYLKEIIEDEGIHVDIANNISSDRIAIIKVDDFYNGLHLAITPKSIDFLVVVDCECDAFVMYLLEMKNVNSPGHLNIKDIHEKFDNTINDFMTERFGKIFLKDRYKYKKILLYLISDAYRICEQYQNFEEYKKAMDKINKRDTLKTEINLGSKLFKFKGKVLKIVFDIPPNPIIQRIS